MKQQKPQYSVLLRTYFLKYTRYMLARSFHAVRLRNSPPAVLSHERLPLLVAVNHSSWWDLLVGGWLDCQMFGRESYGLMDAQQLQRYTIFKHMGVIGVDRSSLNGAQRFLSVCTELLYETDRTLWITPQGAIMSSYHRPIQFQPGLAHLGASLKRFQYCHSVLHYEFGEERLPEVFVQFSPPEYVELQTLSGAKQWMQNKQVAMEQDLDALQAAARLHRNSEFTTLLHGGGGTVKAYDLYRKAQSRLTGRSFQPNHGDVITPQWRERR